MFSQLIKPFCLTRSFLRGNSFMFSTNPTPNQNPRNNEDRPEFKRQNLNSQQKQGSEHSNSIIRTQAKLRVSRAELLKYARTSLDYDKANNHSEKLETTAKYLKNRGFKIRPHSKYAARLQFYRTQEVIKEKQKTNQKQENKDDGNVKQEEFKEQVEELEKKEIYLEVKIFKSAFKQYKPQCIDYMDKLFCLQDQEQNLDSLLTENIWKSKYKGFSEALNNQQIVFDTSNIKKKLSKRNENKQNTFEDYEDRFKEFSVYLRNVNQRSGNAEKWLRVDLLMEDFNQLHLSNLSVIKSIENELEGIPPPNNVYQGIEVKSLDPQSIKLLYKFFVQAPNLSPNLLTAVYYYTFYYESLIYRKWLEDLIDITK